MMNLHLRWISEHVRASPGGELVKVLLVVDNAGWHRSGGLAVPENIELLYLPAYSPELNPVERLWLALRSRHLSNRVFESIEDLERVAASALRRLTPDELRSICRTHWLEGGN